MTDIIELRLVAAPDDPEPRSTEFQADINEFKRGLLAAGVQYSQKGMAFDAVDVMGYPLPVFLAAVSPVAISAINAVVTLVKAWIEQRPGRCLRYKDGETYLQADRVEDLDKLRKFLERRDRIEP